MASWAKKKLLKAKFRIYNRLPLPPPATSPAISPPVEEVVLAAHLGCAKCQKKVADAISRIGEMESIIVHVLEKKVILTPTSMAKGSFIVGKASDPLLLYSHSIYK
ncbi:hypothetical protein JCGZ_05877 [Jatropha curcas]|uniref:HMA domain-containing protein n=1 Tax=Jatropha curcas TaxID=180498 RepID=A0A067JBK2_JATCU|nr:uncharacterized protein LOC110008751 [Jatropha curcas]KDP20108.1 hypothetical protein JCGZ_05877 [Jatropha curcas]